MTIEQFPSELETEQTPNLEFVKAFLRDAKMEIDIGTPADAIADLGSAVSCLVEYLELKEKNAKP